MVFRCLSFAIEGTGCLLPGVVAAHFTHTGVCSSSSLVVMCRMRAAAVSDLLRQGRASLARAQQQGQQGMAYALSNLLYHFVLVRGAAGGCRQMGEAGWTEQRFGVCVCVSFPTDDNDDGVWPHTQRVCVCVCVPSLSLAHVHLPEWIAHRRTRGRGWGGGRWWCWACWAASWR